MWPAQLMFVLAVFGMITFTGLAVKLYYFRNPPRDVSGLGVLAVICAVATFILGVGLSIDMEKKEKQKIEMQQKMETKQNK
jgi:hypothetical protein